MVVWCSQGSCTGDIWFLVVGSTDQKRVHFTAKQVFMWQKNAATELIIYSKSSECALVEGMITYSWKNLLPDLHFFKVGTHIWGGGVPCPSRDHWCYKFPSTMMHMDMMNNDSEHKLFNSESLPTIQYYQHFGYVWANIEKFWSQHNFWENPWIYLCHFAQQDVAKSVSLHNGTSPQAGQQKGVLLSSFFQFFPCLTFFSKYCLQRVRTLTYRSTVLAKCLGGGGGN